MEIHVLLLGLVAFVLPIYIGIRLSKQAAAGKAETMKWLAIAAVSSFLLTFFAWMIMRVYIGRTGGSLGVFLNLAFSRPFWIPSILIAAAAFSVTRYKERS